MNEKDIEIIIKMHLDQMERAIASMRTFYEVLGVIKNVK